jgi:hypothetical protein
MELFPTELRVTINSNIRVVIGRLQLLKKGVPEALRRAIAPERWAEELKDRAEFVMRMEAGPDGEWAVDQFLALMGSAFFGNKSQWWMSAPAHNESEALASAVDVAKRYAPQGGIQGMIGKDQLDMLDKVSVEDARSLIRQWVMAGAEGDAGGKELKGDDLDYLQKQGEYDNELVERVWRVFGIHPAAVGRIGTDDADMAKQEEAIQGLTGHIVQYFSGESQRGLSADTVDAWLRKVLAAWALHIEQNLPLVIQEELDRMKAA